MISIKYACKIHREFIHNYHDSDADTSKIKPRKQATPAVNKIKTQSIDKKLFCVEVLKLKEFQCTLYTVLREEIIAKSQIYLPVV